LADCLKELEDARNEPTDAFYAAWVEDIVQQAVESLAAEYFAQRKGDYVRVLYGRLCRRMTIAEVAGDLEISASAVDNYYRHARDRLAEKLESSVRRQVARYCRTEETEQEIVDEWGRLGQYLADRGGLEEAVRQAYDLLDPVTVRQHKGERLTRAVTRLTSMMRAVEENRPAREEGS
jgi:hypothetical protein